MRNATTAPARTGQLVLSVAALVGLVALAAGWIIAADLFVLTEARWFISQSPPIDWLRLLLLPQLHWGDGRLTGILTFQLTGALCGVDHRCVNGVGAALTAAGAALLVVHGRQLSGSLPLAGAAAIAWLVSAPTLAVLLWQAARFDLLALIGSVALATAWWAWLGRERLAPREIVAFELASLLLLAFALNAKESSYYLVGALPLVAVLRGAPIERIRRNVWLALPPLAYATFFVAWALTHVSPDYGRYAASQSPLEGLFELVTQGLGVNAELMYTGQSGPLLEALRTAARLLYAALAALLLAMAGGALLARRRSAATEGPRERRAGWRGLLAGVTAEIYLGLTVAAHLLVGARSEGAAAHYTLLAYWAAVMLLLLTLRRLGALGPRWRTAAATALVVAAVAGGAVYASQHVDRSLYRQITAASVQVRQLGERLAALLGDRQVSSVRWRSVEMPSSAFFILRSGPTNDVGPDLWPFMVGDTRARPSVTPLASGTAAELLARAGDFAAPGEVLVAIDAEYRLLLLVHAGEVLHADLEAGR